MLARLNHPFFVPLFYTFQDSDSLCTYINMKLYLTTASNLSIIVLWIYTILTWLFRYFMMYRFCSRTGRKWRTIALYSQSMYQSVAVTDCFLSVLNVSRHIGPSLFCNSNKHMNTCTCLKCSLVLSLKIVRSGTLRNW